MSSQRQPGGGKRERKREREEEEEKEEEEEEKEEEEEGIPEARQFFFQFSTVIQSKLFPTTITNGPIHTIQKPADWPEEKAKRRRG